MTKKAINAVFVGLILVLLGAGLARTVFFPKEVNTYENRYAEKIAPLTLEGWLDGSFQDSVDAALADQVQLAQGICGRFPPPSCLWHREGMCTTWTRWYSISTSPTRSGRWRT